MSGALLARSIEGDAILSVFDGVVVPLEAPAEDAAQLERGRAANTYLLECPHAATMIVVYADGESAEVARWQIAADLFDQHAASYGCACAVACRARLERDILTLAGFTIGPVH